jgi:hypothetical protein
MSQFSGALLPSAFCSQANHWLHMVLQTVRYETLLPRQTAACCGSDCCPSSTIDIILRHVVLTGHGARCIRPRQFLQFLGKWPLAQLSRDLDTSRPGELSYLMDCATRDNSGRKEMLFKKWFFGYTWAVSLALGGALGLLALDSLTRTVSPDPFICPKPNSSPMKDI